MDAQEYVPMEHAMNAIVRILRMASRLVFLHAAGGWGRVVRVVSHPFQGYEHSA